MPTMFASCLFFILASIAANRLRALDVDGLPNDAIPVTRSSEAPLDVLGLSVSFLPRKRYDVSNREARLTVERQFIKFVHNGYREW